MRIDSSGRVLIGTTSASYGKLVIAGTTADVAMQINDTTYTTAGIGFNGSGSTNGVGAPTQTLYFGQYNSYPIVFTTGNAERMRIDSSGNLLVGTTATVSSAKFIASGSVGDSVSRMINSNASPSGLLINYSGATPNGGNNPFLNGYDGDYSNLRYKMASNGGLYNYSANNSNLSDIREKKNIELAGNYLDKICNIPVKTFLYNDQTDTDLNLGVIAQDVEAVAPELVMESNWGSEETPRVRLSIYQTDLQYALMKAIQEQQALITDLTTRLAALEGAK
jgi:hypothetical protein